MKEPEETTQDDMRRAPLQGARLALDHRQAVDDLPGALPKAGLVVRDVVLFAQREHLRLNLDDDDDDDDSAQGTTPAYEDVSVTTDVFPRCTSRVRTLWKLWRGSCGKRWCSIW